MNGIFRFREFPVYISAREFRKGLKRLSKEKIPKQEDFILRSQLWRALDSVVLNIAEGSDRHSDKDFSHFLNMAVGSLNEVVSCIDCALDDNYFDEEDHRTYITQAENITRQLKAFLAKVRKDNRRF